MTGFMQPVNWGAFRDEGIMVATLLAMLAVHLVRPRGRSPLATLAGWILLAGSAAALVAGLIDPVPDSVLWGGAWVVDPLAKYFKALFLLSLGLVVLAGQEFMAGKPARDEFFLVLGASTVGMMLLVGAGDLVALFVALELVSIPLYLAASLARDEVTSQEAGLKYLIVGAFSTALFLFGLSFIYAACGSTGLPEIRAAVGNLRLQPLVVAGLALVLAGVGFKIAAVPFHMWAPDVYQGGLTPMVAFASVASKAAGFAVMIRLLLGSLAGTHEAQILLFSVLAVLTMTVGSLLAIPQTNIKRLLAYSSVAQAGYILIGFAAGTERGVAAVLFYLLVYLFTNLGAFITVMIFAKHAGSDDIAAYAGLARRSPLLALAFMLALLSLAGIPPLGGFVGKLYLFASAMEVSHRLLWLVVVGAVLSIVSLFYYLMVIRQVYISQPGDQSGIRVGPGAAIALLACVAGMILTGVWPGPAIDLARSIAAAFFAR
jgi:NADH-quinone oxidoreductase subunit N